MNKKKQLTLSIGLILVLVLMIVGVSYAAYTFAGSGQKPNVITTGVTSMEYTESDNIINLKGALPTTDATGKKRLNEGEYFDFTVSSTIKGSNTVNWEIAAEDVTSSTAKKIDGKYIKLYLTSLDDNGNETEVMQPKVFTTKVGNTYTGRPSGMMSLALGTATETFKTKYRLRMYVDESYNPQGDGGDLNFSVKVNVYGKVTTDEMPQGGTLKAYMMPSETGLPETDFHTSEYKEKITSIVTKNDNTVPTTAIASYDVSEEQNKSVMAYLEDDGTEAGTYKLTIGSKGKIIASESMKNYFYGFTNVKSMDLSNLDTSFTTNMDSMFINCSSLTELDISNFDISNVTTFGGSLLYGCNNLVSLNMSGLNFMKNSSPIIIGAGNENLKVNLSDANFSGINISGTFSGIAEIDLTNTNFQNSNMSRAFQHTSIKKVNFSNADFTNANMQALFAGNSNLISVDLSNAKTIGVTDMSGMFNGCSNLKSVNLTGFNSKSDTNLYVIAGSATAVLSGITSNSSVTNISSMFNGCSSLVSLDLSNFDTSSVTDMSSMFWNCGSLTNLNMSDLDFSSATDTKYNLFYNTNNELAVNMSNASFKGLSSNSISVVVRNITNLDLSNANFTNANLTNMFSGCTNLKSVDLSNAITTGVTQMEGMFGGCRSLANLVLTGFNSKKNSSDLTNVKEMFYNCTGLTSIDLSDFNTSNITNMSAMFYGCSNLVSANLSGFDFSKIASSSMSPMFGSNSKTIKVNMSKANFEGLSNNIIQMIMYDIAEIDLTNTNFKETVTRSSFVSSVTKKVDFTGADFTNANMSGMFSSNSGLTSVNFNNIKTTGVTDMSNMFANSNLTSLDLSDFDISSVTNMTSMFNGASKLTTITVSSKWKIGNGVTTTDMFKDCGTDHVTVA